MRCSNSRLVDAWRTARLLSLGMFAFMLTHLWADRSVAQEAETVALTPEKTLEGHTSAVETVCYSPDGTMIASGSFDRTVCVWNATTGALLHKIVTHATKEGQSTWTPQKHSFEKYLADVRKRNPDWDEEKLLASAKRDLKRATANRDALLASGYRGRITAVRFSPDSSELVALCWAGSTVQISLYKVSDGQHLRTWVSYDSFAEFRRRNEAAMRAAKAGRRLGLGFGGGGGGGGGGIGQPPWSIEYTADGQRLIVGNKTGDLFSWNRKGSLVATIKASDSGVAALAIAPGDSRSQKAARLATLDSYGTIRFWNSSGKRIKEWDAIRTVAPEAKNATVTLAQLAFTPDGKKLVMGSTLTAKASFGVSIWSIPAGKLLKVVPHTGRMFVLTPEGDQFAVGSRKYSLGFYGIADGELKKGFRFIRPKRAYVHSYTLSPDGYTSATGHSDGAIRLWNVGSLPSNKSISEDGDSNEKGNQDKAEE